MHKKILLMALASCMTLGTVSAQDSGGKKMKAYMEIGRAHV